MPLPKPQPSETQDAFIARCMKDPATQDITGDTQEQTQQRRLAACFRQWREKADDEDGHERKSLVSFEIKDAAKGLVEAVFSTFGVKDKQGDWTLPGAFDGNGEVLIGAYGHRTWFGEPPVGKGVIESSEQDARLVGQFFLDSCAGKELFTVVKNLGPKQQWSYGYDVKETGEVTPELEQKGVRRVLKKVLVHEVSPVLVGAGSGTRTVATKAADEAAKALALHLTKLDTGSWDGPAEVAAMDAARMRESCLAFTGGDPEAKAGYKLPYRDREGDVSAAAARAIAARLPKTDLPAAIRGEVEANAKRLMAWVQENEKQALEIEETVAMHERDGVKFA